MPARQDTLIHIHIRLNHMGYSVEEVRKTDAAIKHLPTAELIELMRSLDWEHDTRKDAEAAINAALNA